MRAHKWWGATVLLSALFVFGCQSPTSSSSPATASKDTSGAGVYGTFTGVVTDSITQQPLAGVTVTVSTGTGNVSAVTDASGIYTLSGLHLGTYTVSFVKTGYQAVTQTGLQVTDTTGYTPHPVTVNGQTFTTDKDPFLQYSFALQELADYFAVANANANAQAPLSNGSALALPNSQWTYNSSTGNYTLSGTGTNTVNVTVNKDNTLKVTYSDLSEEKRVWVFSKNLTLAELAPLSAGLKGSITVWFSKATNKSDTTASAPIKAGVKVWAVDTTGLTTDTPVVDPPTYGGSTPDLVRYGPATTDANGAFDLEGLPAGRTLTLWVEPFSQALGTGANAVVSYIAGPAAGSDPDKSGNSWLGDNFVTEHNISKNLGGGLAVYKFEDKAILVSHNIGDVNAATPLTVDGTVQTGYSPAISLTFNKAINPDSFKDAFVDIGGDGTYTTGTDVYLDATWSTDGTTVTLKPRAVLGNAKLSQLPYGLVGGNATLVLPSTAQATDGSSVRYADYTGPVGSSTGAQRLKIYTESPVHVTNLRFLDASGNAVEYQNTFEPSAVANWKLPLDGKVEITYSKPLAAAANQTVYVYDRTDSGNTVILAAALGSLSKTASASVSVLGNVLTVSFSKLSTNTRYDIGVNAVSTRPYDTPVSSDVRFIGFMASDGVKLVGTNLYSPVSTLYYTGVPSRGTKYFPTNSALVLTFDRAFPTGTSAVVEFYKKSDLTGLYNNPQALYFKQVALTSATLSTTGTPTLTIDPVSNLEPATEYSLAVRLLRADGTELFYTKGLDFFNSYSVGGALVNPVVDSYNPDLSGGLSSYYIDFTTAATFAPVLRYNPAAPISETNLRASATTINTTSVYGSRSTDIKGNVPIVIQFNKDIAPVSAGDVVLSYWVDANSNTSIDQGELTTVSGTTVNVSADTLTVTPPAVLAPGKNFVLRLKLANIDDPNDQFIADTFYNLPAILPYAGFSNQGHLIFKTDTTVIPLTLTGANTITNAKVLDTITGITGVDSSASSVQLSFDTTKKLLNPADLTGYYHVYTKRVGIDTDWQSDSSYAEDGSILAWLNTTKTVSGTIPAVYSQSGLVFGREVDYLVTAWDASGLALQSAIVPVTDTVKPLAIFTANNFESAPNTPIVAGGNIYPNDAAGTVSATALVATQVGGTGPWSYTNATAGSPTVYFDISFDNASGENIKSVVVTPSFADSKVTAAYYNPTNSTTGGKIRITIPGGSYLKTGDSVGVQFQDTSGNLSVTNRNSASPAAAVLTSRTVP